MDSKQASQILKLLQTSYSFYKVDEGTFYALMISKDFKPMYQAALNFCKKSKYAPTLNDLEVEYDQIFYSQKNLLVEKMSEQGYFKTELEKTKSLKFILDNTIPDFLYEMILDYCKKNNVNPISIGFKNAKQISRKERLEIE